MATDDLARQLVTDYTIRNMVESIVARYNVQPLSHHDGERLVRGGDRNQLVADLITAIEALIGQLATKRFLEGRRMAADALGELVDTFDQGNSGPVAMCDDLDALVTRLRKTE